ncbi:MAG: hypothetical protein K940chlam3_00279 [Chlamydiae bacterium]|nr:hypothetical protein [Chlamydiota bacterium]
MLKWFKSSLFLPHDNSSIKKTHRIQFSGKDDVSLKNYSIEEFEEASGMTYLSGLGFRSEGSYERVKRLTLKSVAEGKISQRAHWFGSHFADFLDRGYVNDVSIRWVDEKMNYGLFAEKDIKRHAYLGEYTGLVKPCTIFTGDVNEYCFRYPLYHRFFIVYTIDAKMHGNEISFINHCNSPNCEAVVVYHNDLFHMCLRAIDEIKEGDQLFFDYGNEKWRNFKS